MKKVFIFLMVLLSQQLFGQFSITGKVVDAESGKGLSMVQISADGSKAGGLSDLQGSFKIMVPNRKGVLKFYFVGYKPETVNFKIKDDILELGNILLTPLAYSLDEVTISAGLAQKTDPVSISEISAKSIQQQLGSKPLPLLFNTIPGVFSVSQGGGTGDASMSIRGFKQDNIGLLVNGVPVNGVENGLVYWSNWQGLSDASASIQIQKGPGVANVAANAVGGSVNIITSNPVKPKGGMVSWQVTSFGNQKVSLALNSGKMNNGWNLSLLGSYESGKGYVDATFVRSWAYYFSATKRFNKKNKLNITLLGSPQRHGQRTLRLSKEEVDMHGYKFNKDWGGFNGEIRNASENFYHKPFLSINHYLTIDDSKQWANSVYVSYGNGGGLWSESFNYAPSIFSYRDDAGQLDWQAVYHNNTNHDGEYVLANGDTVSGYSMNVQTGFLASHVVAGWMSTYEQKFDHGFKFVAGLHYRYFNSFLREEIFDLLGGSFFIEDYGWSVAGVADRNQIKMPGDIIRVDNNSIVNYLGAYAQLLYDGSHLNGYLSLNGNSSFYRRIDRFNYVDNSKSELITKPGFDVRSGLAYKLGTAHKLYANAAYLSKAPYFKYVFGNFTNVPVSNLKNEQVATMEIGYAFNKGGLNGSLGGYYTLWKNVSMLSNEYIQLEDNTQTRAMVNGLDALHKGMEASLSYRWKNRWRIGLFGSLGDYRWQNDVEATLFNDNNVAVDTVRVYASGLFVGGTAQQQLGASVDFPVFDLLNIKFEWIWFGRLYADFDPVTRTDESDRDQSYRFPSYNLANLYLNVPFNLGSKHGSIDLGFNNLLNEHYITVGQDGTNHDINTFTGFWSEGFTFNIRLGFYF
jgi:outer membrane receptor protein involved in Fe transport